MLPHRRVKGESPQSGTYYITNCFRHSNIGLASSRACVDGGQGFEASQVRQVSKDTMDDGGARSEDGVPVRSVYGTQHRGQHRCDAVYAYQQFLQARALTA